MCGWKCPPSRRSSPRNPIAQTVKLGTNVTFVAAASGLPAPNFQWQFNGTNISGATNASYALAFVAATNAGNYSVAATNIAGAATSSNALLALLPPSAAQFQSITCAWRRGANQFHRRFRLDLYD